VNAFHLEFPTPDGTYMGHRDSYAASAMCRDGKKLQDFLVSALFEDEGSHTSSDSETRLEEDEEDNVIEEIGSEIKSEDNEEVVVHETEGEVVVPQTH
jgi:hypothetical protein